jgi:hypothetical protein
MKSFFWEEMMEVLRGKSKQLDTLAFHLRYWFTTKPPIHGAKEGKLLLLSLPRVVLSGIKVLPMLTAKPVQAKDHPKAG